MNITPELVTPIGVLVLIIILIINPIINKLDINWIFKRKQQRLQNQRIISDDEIKQLRNHIFFVEIDKLLHHDLKRIYYNSKKEFAQKIFTLFNHYFLVVLKEDILVGINSLLTDKHKEYPQTISDLEHINLHLIPHFNEQIDFIPTALKNKFMIWYDNNFKWYYNSINKITVPSESYYNNIDDYLKLSITFIYAMHNNIKESIDKFNGDVSEYEEILSQYKELYNKITYLND